MNKFAALDESDEDETVPKQAAPVKEKPSKAKKAAPVAEVASPSTTSPAVQAPAANGKKETTDNKSKAKPAGTVLIIKL
jgi:hypothetical protein